MKWTVFLRSPYHEDLSTFISTVTFQLHDDFRPKNRVYEKQPYEVTEQGWGQFQMFISIHFRADKHLAVKIPYHLHLLNPAQLTTEKFLFIAHYLLSILQHPFN